MQKYQLHGMLLSYATRQTLSNGKAIMDDRKAELRLLGCPGRQAYEPVENGLD
jgi:hypothetical protein